MKRALRKNRAAINEIDITRRRAGEHDACDGASIPRQTFSQFAPRPYLPRSQFRRLTSGERKAAQNAKELERANSQLRLLSPRKEP